MRPVLFALLALLAFGGCRTFDPHHPLIGEPEIHGHEAAFWIWFTDGTWSVRFVGGGRNHRFQGSVAGINGGVIELHRTQHRLRSQVAVVGDAVQFDVETPAPASDVGFDVKLVGGCARFDLYLDGRHRPERIRLGPRGLLARHDPIDRCP